MPHVPLKMICGVKLIGTAAGRTFAVNHIAAKPIITPTTTKITDWLTVAATKVLLGIP